MPESSSGDDFTDVTPALTGAPEDTPAMGSVVGLLATHVPGKSRATGRTDSPVMTATLEAWHSEPGGMTVMADLQADAETIEAVSGASVWGSFSTPSDALIVVAALARERSGADGHLELTGVRMVAYEPRRRAARAGLARPVRLHSGSGSHEAVTLDLSRGGCRVFTSHPGDPLDPGSPGNLHAGYALGVELELDDGHVLATDALVVRADGPELALRFTGLAASDAAEVDAAVFRELVRADG